MTYFLLAYEFFKAGLFAIGGGLATLPYLMEMSQNHPTWFTLDELMNMIAVSESTPGPIGVNMASYVGFHVGGVLGEVAEHFDIEGAVTVVTADAKIYIPLSELVDKDAELARLNKELEQVKKRLAQSEGKLNNAGFVAKAPEAVIEKVKGQAAKEREQIALITAAIDALK